MQESTFKDSSIVIFLYIG